MKLSLCLLTSSLFIFNTISEKASFFKKFSSHIGACSMELGVKFVTLKKNNDSERFVNCSINEDGLLEYECSQGGFLAIFRGGNLILPDLEECELKYLRTDYLYHSETSEFENEDVILMILQSHVKKSAYTRPLEFINIFRKHKGDYEKVIQSINTQFNVDAALMRVYKSADIS